jgi:hypothetical protein
VLFHGTLRRHGQHRNKLEAKVPLGTIDNYRRNSVRYVRYGEFDH